ncbi:arsenate reductase (glutaredoxin) [Oleiphilus messinensis]|uniref:Arsenate reductase (Glutaredoxin) n=1 Tax=Oleiphilus messinensis TaxID=141451 RepID=A0A1Y0I4S2_9GAMM|nr:arsenate reductase ArsC [Oleiphilus messinensis]ARU54535.1 arsenate reductase (glutaredoxin) [Oleiphilus messinensis]
MKQKLLFLCTGNSCRSQMAEAWGKTLLAEQYECYSAGIVAHGMNPNVQQVMSEVGVSLDGHYSKTLEDLKDPAGHNMGLAFDYIVTVCDNAAESCPVLPNSVIHIHHPFPDPPRLAKEADNDESRLDCYRQVRDQIRDWLKTSPLLMTS